MTTATAPQDTSWQRSITEHLHEIKPALRRKPGLTIGDVPETMARVEVFTFAGSYHPCCTIKSGAVTLSLLLTSAEAEAMGRAFLAAAKVASDNEMRRELEVEQLCNLDEERDLADERDLEHELFMDAQARGEEYVPHAIGKAHIDGLLITQHCGQTLPSWGKRLVPSLKVRLRGHDCAWLRVLDDEGSVYCTMFRWTENKDCSGLQGMRGLAYWYVIDDSEARQLLCHGTGNDDPSTYLAVVDDFGDLYEVPWKALP